MPKWTEYTSKDTLADNDEVMLYDATGRANKRGLMSKFWDYVVDKMSTAVISKLETENKTVIGALNYLNGNSKPYYSGVITSSSTSVSMHYGIYLVATYRAGGYKISSVSILNIQIQNGSFIEILAKGIDFDDSIKFECTEHEFLFQYKLTINGAAGIRIYKL
jgi:hypothetical protein